MSADPSLQHTHGDTWTPSYSTSVDNQDNTVPGNSFQMDDDDNEKSSDYLSIRGEKSTTGKKPFRVPL